VAAQVVLLALALSLPRGAKLIEVAPLPASVHKDRALVLWMRVRSSTRNCDDWKEEWAPICPGSTSGCSYSGPTRVSLVDTATNKIINTIVIRDSHDAPSTFIGAQRERGRDSLVIPYWLGDGGPYAAKDGKPHILLLKDYNGDGDATEFALFNAWSCSDLLTTLIGYSRKQDRVIRYPVRLRWTESESSEEITSYWVEHLFANAPEKPGVWKYTARYPGADETYEIHYDAEHEAFEGTCRVKSN
jgi:hypothetical protein